MKPSPSAHESSLELRGFSYEDRDLILEALLTAMTTCGGWILDQRTLSPSQTELHFEVQLRSAFELYGGLIAAGVELTRESHQKMTELCTLRGHNPHKARKRRILTVRLEMSFLDEDATELGTMAVGVA